MAKPAEIALVEMRRLGYSHRLMCQSLYRQVLRSHGDWDVDRALYNDSCARVREQWEAARKEADRQKVASFLKDQEDWLVKFRHPDSYKLPWQDGGATYERNVPPPAEICNENRQVPFGVETKVYSGTGNFSST